MTIWEAIILGIVEGITEFLPVSSTGHLTITEKLLGLPVDDPAVTAYTAVIQVGAIAAVFVYFWRDIARLSVAWTRGLFRPAARADFDYRFGWYVIAGSVPIGLVGFFGQDVIKGPLRSLWWVAGSLIVWSAAMVYAERVATQARGEKELTLVDTLVIGVAQCLALVPGVSRSGATITVGLLRGLDRVTATRLSFFLSIPALTAAGVYQLPEALSDSIGIAPLVIGTLVSFLVAYASVAWLLRFVAHHSIVTFVWYRLALGAVLIAVLAAGWLAAT
ncbi:MAG TPA: undecaprenyl-diphosphate phosphatase [Micromonosporaceae bacterium]|nr:undecaprenyl-diphosphate phosphatase [Micromonosporaceae bacterium]